MEMITYEFIGYVVGITKTNWGTDIKASTVKNDSEEKYPQRILFSTSKKSAGKVPDDLCEGDKIKVQFAPYLNEGVSKAQRVYAINKNMIINITVLEHCESALPDEPEDSSEELPF